jgi:hypothetical protein
MTYLQQLCPSVTITTTNCYFVGFYALFILWHHDIEVNVYIWWQPRQLWENYIKTSQLVASINTSRTLIWGSHRPLHGVANVMSSVANDETGFKF